jgi:hypothetical protein
MCQSISKDSIVKAVNYELTATTDIIKVCDTIRKLVNAQAKRIHGNKRKLIACTRCNGSGFYAIGTCFRCGGQRSEVIETTNIESIQSYVETMTDRQVKAIETSVNKKIEKATASKNLSVSKAIQYAQIQIEKPLQFGKYEGLTFEQLVEEDVKYAIWLADDNANNQNHKYGENARHLAVEQNKFLVQARQDIAKEERVKQEMKELAKLKSDALGDVGERVEVEAVVEHTMFIDNDYGGCTLVKMRSGDNAITWFATNPKGLVKGDTVSMKCRIKNTDLYKNEMVTTITRPTFTSITKAQDETND